MDYTVLYTTPNMMIRTINDQHWRDGIALLQDIRSNLEFPKSAVIGRQDEWKFVVGYVDGVKWHCETYYADRLIERVERSF